MNENYELDYHELRAGVHFERQVLARRITPQIDSDFLPSADELRVDSNLRQRKDYLSGLGISESQRKTLPYELGREVQAYINGRVGQGPSYTDQQVHQLRNKIRGVIESRKEGKRVSSVMKNSDGNSFEIDEGRDLDTIVEESSKEAAMSEDTKSPNAESLYETLRVSEEESALLNQLTDGKAKEHLQMIQTGTVETPDGERFKLYRTPEFQVRGEYQPQLAFATYKSLVTGESASVAELMLADVFGINVEIANGINSTRSPLEDLSSNIPKASNRRIKNALYNATPLSQEGIEDIVTDDSLRVTKRDGRLSLPRSSIGRIGETLPTGYESGQLHEDFIVQLEKSIES